MSKAPRGKRVADSTGESFRVVNKAPNGQAEPFFDRTREVWVAPWRKPDGKVGRPTGKTRALALASRDRHVAKANEEARYGALEEGFSAETTVGELAAWWLEHMARHRVRPTSLATYREHVVVIDEKLGAVSVRKLRPEQVTTFVSDLIDEGSPSRARHVRTLLVQILEQGVELGLAAQNVAHKVKAPEAAPKQRRTVTPAETQRLLAECDHRFAAAAALCFVQGWWISEALGLAWQDHDLESGSVLVRRGSTYADGIGMTLGPTKTRGATGTQLLGRTVVALLSARWAMRLDDEANLPEPWPRVEYDGEQLDLVFTTAHGTRPGPSTSRTSRGSSGTTMWRRRVATCSTKAVALAKSVNAPSISSILRRRRRGSRSARSQIGLQLLLIVLHLLRHRPTVSP